MNYTVQTAYPVAVDSVDHLHPRGTKNDNSTNPEFNRRLFAHLVGRTPVVLDLGCSGGGFVESILQMGGIAVGVEGSDYSKRLGRAAWERIPENLFTADIGKPFLILSSGFLCSFSVITMWEVLEHLNVDQLEVLMLNLHAHTRHGALFVCSVNTRQDHFEGIDYHATVHSSEWWEGFFGDRGWLLRWDLYDVFHPHWVRGPNTEGASSTCFVLNKP